MRERRDGLRWMCVCGEGSLHVTSLNGKIRVKLPIRLRMPTGSSLSDCRTGASFRMLGDLMPHTGGR